MKMQQQMKTRLQIKIKLISVLALCFFSVVSEAQSRQNYEEPTDYETLKVECHSEELGEESVIHGLVFSTYAERTIEIYPAADGKYLVKDGLFDGNGSGIFTVDQKWIAQFMIKGSSQILRSETDSSKSITLPLNSSGAGTISYGFPQNLTCSGNK